MPFDDDATALSGRVVSKKLSPPLRFFMFAAFLVGVACLVPNALVTPTITTYLTSINANVTAATWTANGWHLGAIVGSPLFGFFASRFNIAFAFGVYAAFGLAAGLIYAFLKNWIVIAVFYSFLGFASGILAAVQGTIPLRLKKSLFFFGFSVLNVINYALIALGAGLTLVGTTPPPLVCGLLAGLMALVTGVLAVIAYARAGRRVSDLGDLDETNEPRDYLPHRAVLVLALPNALLHCAFDSTVALLAAWVAAAVESGQLAFGLASIINGAPYITGISMLALMLGAVILSLAVIVVSICVRHDLAAFAVGTGTVALGCLLQIPFADPLPAWQAYLGAALLLALGSTIASAALLALAARALHASLLERFLDKRSAVYYQLGLLSAAGHVGGFLGTVGVQAANGYSVPVARITFAVLLPLLVLAAVLVCLYFVRNGSVLDSRADYAPVDSADRGL